MKILELKNSIAKIKISEHGLNRRMQTPEERVGELEDGKTEITLQQPEQRIHSHIAGGESLQPLWKHFGIFLKN